MRYSSRVNPFLSRRRYNSVCEWWAPSNYGGQIPLYKMAVTMSPAGKFHAKALSDFSYNRDNESSIRISNSFVTIETPDDVSMMVVDSIVRYQGILYRVSNVSKREIAKTRQFMRVPLFIYVIQLTR